MEKTITKADSQLTPRDKLLPRLTMVFFKRSRTTALLWLMVFVFGIASYTTLLKREGFPSINIPLVIVNGSYAVDDASRVDAEIAGPLSKLALKQPNVSSVQASSEGNFFSATVMYDENADASQSKRQLESAVKAADILPPNAHVSFDAPYFGVTGGSLEKIDATVSLYSRANDLSSQQLTGRAEAAVNYLNRQRLSQVDHFFVQSPFEQVTNPANGQAVQVQRTFDRYATRSENRTGFYHSVIIGVASTKGADVIKLDNQIRQALDSLEKQPQFRDIETAVSASYAPTIREEIAELQRVLLEGLLAVLIIASIVIAVRASIITVLSMLTVISVVLGVLFLIGYTLNVITLFAIILGLSLIVDDTIIMVEAIDASRKREKTAREAVAQATRKISRAMVAATFTAALSFTPLLFVGGILGSFIRAVPVTIIAALLTSLLVALIFIPLFAKFLLLGKKQMGEENVRELAAAVEHRIAEFIARPILWAKHSRRKEFTVGITAVLIGFGFIAGAGVIFKHVTFNIFPPTKDTNQLVVNLTLPPGTDITEAEAIVDRADALTSKTLGESFVNGSYYGMASAQAASLYINITPYDKRVETSPRLVEKLNTAFASFDDAKASAAQLDVGPPAAAFTVNINATDRAAAVRLSADMAAYLQGHKLIRPSGTVATIKQASVDNTAVYKRVDGKPVLSIQASFDADDTTTLTGLAKTAVSKEFTAKKLASYNLQPKDVVFDLGEEQQNQDSFKTLALAFPALLLVIYLLLALQFRSLLQPVLIFLAIPFSLFGVTLGLYLTDNAFSFFAMLGFFALIGLSLKNTILLTDYANQARHAGMGPIDAAVAALGERFRPLVATSITAVVSLIPLAITSPFWQGLAVVLIFGLLSSTFLVITVFPYYYLGAEYLRLRVSRRGFFLWLLLNIALAVVMSILLKNVGVIAVFLIACNAAWAIGRHSWRRA